MNTDTSEIDDQQKDIDVAEMCLSKTRDALKDGDHLEVIEQASHVIAWAVKAAQRDTPVATIEVDRVGNFATETRHVKSGESDVIEIDGKAVVRVSGEELLFDVDGGDE